LLIQSETIGNNEIRLWDPSLPLKRKPAMPVLKLPEVTLSDGQVVQVIQPLKQNLPAGFPAWPPATQQNAITALEEFLQEVRRNGSIEHMSELGLINPGQAIRDQGTLDGPRLKLDLIDRCNWQLAQLLRVSYV
jgi:hypothetical protein